MLSNSLDNSKTEQVSALLRWCSFFASSASTYDQILSFWGRSAQQELGKQVSPE